MNRFCIALIFTLLSFSLLAQFNPIIRTGRPGQAIDSYTIGKNVFQVQSGILYNKISFNSTETNTWLHNTVLRFGILRKLEVSSLINWQTDKHISNMENDRQSGISNTQIGLRYNLLENKKAIPAIGIQGRLLLNAQSKNYRRSETGANITLVTGNHISNWLALITNWSISWLGNGNDPQSNYALSASFSFTDNLGGFVEVYGPLNNFDTNFDTGFSYIVNDNLQLDISTGWQGNDMTDDWFLDFGISWRVYWLG